MKEFAKTHYKKFAYISFVDTPEAINIFDGNYNLDNMLLGISILTKVQITPRDTLIILDEIQECERALNALKFFKENAPDNNVVGFLAAPWSHTYKEKLHFFEETWKFFKEAKEKFYKED